MPLIPQEVSNALVWVLIVGIVLPAVIEGYWGEPPVYVKVIVCFGMIIAPLLGLVYNLFTTIVRVLV